MRVIFIGHSAQRSGAPLVLHSFLEWLKENASVDFQLLLKTGGPLVSGYEALGPTSVLEMRHFAYVRRVLRSLRVGRWMRRVWWNRGVPQTNTNGASLVYVNTVASLGVLRRLNLQDVPVLVHVHELEDVIRLNASGEDLALMKARARHYLTVSEAAKDNLVNNHSVPPKRITVVRPFLRNKTESFAATRSLRIAARRRLGIPEDAMVVGGCGGISAVKGTDLFVSIAGVLAKHLPNGRLRFLWIGGHREEECEFVDQLKNRVQSEGLDQVVQFLGELPAASSLFSAFDVFSLSSRSDAMATVAIEAGAAGVPIVCFNGAGGIPEFVGSECGICVPYLDDSAMATALLRILKDAELREILGRAAHARACTEYGVDVVAPNILRCIYQCVEKSSD